MLGRDTDREQKAFQPEWPERDDLASRERQRKIIHIDMDGAP
jgi:hypothetical protein